MQFIPSNVFFISVILFLTVFFVLFFSFFSFLWCPSFFMLLKFSLSVFYHLYNRYCELCIWKIACLHFIRSFSDDFSWVFICGMFVSPFWLPLCVCFYVLDLLWLPVFVGWSYTVGVLWSPVVQSPWLPELELCVHYVYPPVIFEPWLLLARPWVKRPSGWLAVRIGHDHSVRDAVRELIPQSRICPSTVRSLLRPPSGCAVYGAN